MAYTKKFTHKPNKGSLFRNTEKRDEHDRDYRGDANIDGVEYWISGYINEGKNGKFQGLTFKRKDAEKGARGAEPPEDDEIPF